MKAEESEQILELIQGPMDNSSSMIRTQKQEVKLHKVFLDEDIGEPKKYRDLIHHLFQAEEHDVFVFIINSVGGYLSTAVAIIEAIKSTNAEVRAVLVGECHSAASMIALNCHNIVVTDSASMMVHTVQLGYGGNTHAVQKHADFSTKMTHRLLDATYKGFLSDKELSDVKTGVELWLDDKEIGKRLINRAKMHETQAATKPVKRKVKAEPVAE